MNIMVGMESVANRKAALSYIRVARQSGHLIKEVGESIKFLAFGYGNPMSPLDMNHADPSIYILTKDKEYRTVVQNRRYGPQTSHNEEHREGLNTYTVSGYEQTSLELELLLISESDRGTTPKGS